MEQMYGVTDLTHLITSITNNNNNTSSSPTITPPQQHSLLFSGANQHQYYHHHYGDNNNNNAMTMMMLPAGSTAPTYNHDHQVCASADDARTTTTATNFSSYDNNQVLGCNGNYNLGGGGDNGVSARWPRQETLTLLEIRSRLDYKFKEATQKGHLWDELSRILYEEHGYQRSGKKCREKFENLYKYYKKTKEGKSGRQNGKHYRFFLQLEALYGPESSTKRGGPSSNDNNNNNLISPSNSSPYDQQTSDSGNELMIEKSKKRMKGGGEGSKWKVDITDFIDAEMSKVMEKQEVMQDKMMRSIEDKEQEMLLREEKWRKQELERIQKENEFWAGERSWIQARDAAIIEVLHKFKKKGAINQDELVLNKLISSSSSTYDNKNICDDDRGLLLCNNQGAQLGSMLSLLQPNDGSSSSRSNSNAANNNNNISIQESCFRLFVDDGQHLNPWENYGVKLNNQRVEIEIYPAADGSLSE